MSISQILLQDTPGLFLNNKTITSVDLRNTSFTTGTMNNTFKGCNKLTTVTNIPNTVTQMPLTFEYCNSLTTTPTLPDSVTNLYFTFCDCANLTTITTLPTSITDMTSTFKDCESLTQMPVIPNSVVSMSGTFSWCTNLTKTSVLPDSIKELKDVFQHCNRLTTAPAFPQRVYNLQGVFWGCTNLTAIPTLPNSTHRLLRSFDGCEKITTISTIPPLVTNMGSTFNGCINLTGNIMITAPEIDNTTNCFNNTTKSKNVYIPFKYRVNEPLYMYESSVGSLYASENFSDRIYTLDANPTISSNFYYADGRKCTIELTTAPHKISNYISFYGYIDGRNHRYSRDITNTSCDLYYGKNTQTYDSFINSGYTTDGSVNGVYLKDIGLPETIPNWEYTENSQGLVLTKYIGSSTAVTIPTPPAPTKIPESCMVQRVFLKDGIDYTSGPLSWNASITSVDLANTSFINNSMAYAFDYCDKLVTVTNMPEGITNMACCYAQCNNLTTFPDVPDTVTNLEWAFSYCNKLTTAPKLSNYTYDATSVFAGCKNLITTPNIPASVAEFSYGFSDCPKLTGNIVIEAPDIRMADACFNNTSLTKNVYIPFETSCQDRLYCFAYGALIDSTCPCYIYTKTLSLTTSTPLFDGLGTPLNYIIDSVTTGTTPKIKLNISNYSFSRNTAGDMIQGSSTKTYNAFINAGYTIDGSVNGVYLKDIFAPPTKRLNVENYSYTLINRYEATLTQYTGTNVNVTIPELED